ncbi:MAG: SPOR domain-containing protein [Candidatus Eisenbacteria bacterium]
MKRRPLTLVLAFLIAFPPATLAVPDGPSREGDGSSWMSGPFFWGAFAFLNGAILASSIMDMQFYQSRATDLEGTGEDAGDYWDASSREKVMIGISTASLLFSLAALKSSFRNEPAEEPPSFAAVSAPPAAPGVERGVTVLSHEGRIRYDTLVTSGTPAPFEWFEMGKFPAAAGDEGGAVSPEEGTKTAVLPEGEKAVSLGDLADGEDVFTETGIGSGPSSPLDPPPPTDDLDRLLAYLREERARQEGPPKTAPAIAVAEAEPFAPSGGSDPLAGLIRGTDKENGKPAPPAEPEIPREETGPATFSLMPYGVHVSSYRTMAFAEKDEALWAGRGYRVVIEEDVIPEKGTWFRVFLGNFESWGEAKAFAAELTGRYGLDYAQAKKRSGF